MDFTRARDAGEFMQRATLTAPVTRDARTLRDTTQNKYSKRRKKPAGISCTRFSASRIVYLVEEG